MVLGLRVPRGESCVSSPMEGGMTNLTSPRMIAAGWTTGAPQALARVLFAVRGLVGIWKVRETVSTVMHHLRLVVENSNWHGAEVWRTLTLFGPSPVSEARDDDEDDDHHARQVSFCSKCFITLPTHLITRACAWGLAFLSIQ